MSYRKILVGTDGSATADRALEQAAGLARSEGAEVLVLCVYEAPDADAIVRQVEAAPPDLAWRITGSSAAEEILERAAALVEGLGATAKTRYEPGDPAEMLIRVAEEEGCDLILVGNKGMKGVKRFLLGSVPNRVSHHAPCDVLIVKTT